MVIFLPLLALPNYHPPLLFVFFSTFLVLSLVSSFVLPLINPFFLFSHFFNIIPDCFFSSSHLLYLFLLLPFLFLLLPLFLFLIPLLFS